MFFRNLILFRVSPTVLGNWFDSVDLNEPDSFAIDPPPAAKALAECALKPVGALELASQGFVPPHGTNGDGVLLLTYDGFTWLTVGSESKILPPAAINAELAKRIAAMEANEGRKPGGRTRKRIKDDLIHEMLPKALVRPGRTDVYLDHARGLVVVDDPTRKRAESAVSEIRHALGSFPALPLNAEVAPRSVLTGWIAGEALPDGFTLGESAILKDAADHGARARLADQELQSDEVASHLSAGKQCTRLALVFKDLVTFTLDEDLVLRGIRFLDGAVDALDGQESDDIRAELDARFALMTGVLSQLFDALFPALKISEGEG